VAEEKRYITLEEIESAVAKDRDGRLCTPDRLALQDPALGEELVILAVYKAFRRRGAGHEASVKAAKQVLDSMNIEVVYG